MAENNEDYFVPLEDKRVFGAGIKRKRIAFVRASDTPDPGTLQSDNNASSKYLAIVLGKTDSATQRGTALDSLIESDENVSPDALCSVCQQPLVSNGDKLTTKEHETSIAHQLCLEHSHPPSHLDRDHVGLKYLSGYGWDPDSRKGLGVEQKGIRIPIKAKEKNNTVGLGHEIVHKKTPTTARARTKEKTMKTHLLNAKEIRKLEEIRTRHSAELRQSFYGEDLSQYLNPDR